MLLEPDVRKLIQLYTDADHDPVLTPEHLDTLVRAARRPDQDGNLPDTFPVWNPSAAYTLGVTAVPPTRNQHYYKVTTAGTSGASAPTFPLTSGGTVTDGTVVWTEQGQTLWTPTWSIATAVSKGWLLKAALVSNRYTFSDNRSQYSRDQLIKHCLAMAKEWRRGGVSSVQLRSRYAARSFGIVPVIGS